jgi:hypothetical protein
VDEPDTPLTTLRERKKEERERGKKNRDRRKKKREREGKKEERQRKKEERDRGNTWKFQHLEESRDEASLLLRVVLGEVQIAARDALEHRELIF